MRFGLAKSGQTLYVYRAVTQNAQWRLQRAAVTGATNPLSLSFSDYSPLFGYGGTDSAEFVRRIEAICPLADGHVLVADGSHQFTTGMSYIRFYLADAWNVIQLHNVIEMPLAERRTTWQVVAKYASRITAAATSAGVVIVGNADPDGHAVTWTMQNGVESEMAPIAPTDPEADNARILPNTITEINGLLYLTARVVSAQTDSSGAIARTGRDVYLTSSTAAPGLWSFGEQGSWLAPESRNGTMLLMPGTNTGSTIIYVGNGSLALFETTPVQYPTDGTDVTSRDDPVSHVCVLADAVRDCLGEVRGACSPDTRCALAGSAHAEAPSVHWHVAACARFHGVHVQSAASVHRPCGRRCHVSGPR
jgi:hypothetical protein